jgi:Arc/MetJ-type ribon-helix-helix transcriptional regulator
MSLYVPADLEPLILQMVNAGVFSNPEDVIREALVRLHDDQAHFAKLKSSFDEALAELDRGEGKPLDFAEIKRKVRSLAAAQHP